MENSRGYPVQEMVKDFFYFSDGIKYKLVDENEDEDGILIYI